MKNPRAAMPPGTDCFDQTISSLPSRWPTGTGDRAGAQPLQDRAPEKRKAAAQALAKTFKANERSFALITNTLAKDKEISRSLARLPGRRGFTPLLPMRVEREVVDALVASVRAAYPRLSHRYYQLKAGWFKKKKLAHWDRNAPLHLPPPAGSPGPMPGTWVLTAYRGFSPEMASIAERFFTDRWIDAPVRPGRRRARSLTPPRLRASLCAVELSGQAART